MRQIPQPQDLTAAQRKTILAALSLVLFAAIIDISALNVSLPSIGRELGASTSQLQWIVDVYMLVLATILMFAGSMGDRFGRKRALFIGLTFFGLGSLIGMLAPNPGFVILGRAIQGVGGSTMPPVALAIISNMFLDQQARAKAIGTWGATMGVALAAGPLLGGVLTQYFTWRAVFGINIPIVLTAIIIIALVVPETKAGKARKFDLAGQVLAVVTLLSLTFAIIRIGEHGFTIAEVVLLIIAAFGFVGFIFAERIVKEPMLELRFFRSRPFAFANLIAMLAFGAYAGFQFITALYLQNSLGFSALQAGLFLLPMALSNSIMANVSGRMVAKLGPRPPIMMFALILASAAVVLLTGTDNAWLQYLIASILFGGGMGAANASLTNAALSGMPRAQSGVAGATMSTGRQTGQSLGVALFGALLNAGLGAGKPAALAAHPGWWVVLALAIATLVLGYLSGTQAARLSESKVAHLIED